MRMKNPLGEAWDGGDSGLTGDRAAIRSASDRIGPKTGFGAWKRCGTDPTASGQHGYTAPALGLWKPFDNGSPLWSGCVDCVKYA